MLWGAAQDLSLDKGNIHIYVWIILTSPVLQGGWPGPFSSLGVGTSALGTARSGHRDEPGTDCAEAEGGFGMRGWRLGEPGPQGPLLQSDLQPL